MSLAYQPVEGRRAPRDDVDYHCQVRIGASGIANAHLVNISPLGCMIRCTATALPDDGITLRLPIIGPAGGRIVWVKLDRIGIEFAGAIDPRPYALMLEQLNPLARKGRDPRSI